MDPQEFRVRRTDPGVRPLIAGFNHAGWLAVRDGGLPDSVGVGTPSRPVRIFTQQFHDVEGDPTAARPGPIAELPYLSIDAYMTDCHPDAIETKLTGDYVVTAQARNVRAFACWSVIAEIQGFRRTYLRLCWEEEGTS